MKARLTAPLGSWGIAIVVWMVMAIALPCLWTSDLTSTLSTLGGQLTFAVIQLSAWMFVRLLIAGQPRYMAFAFWIFVYIWFGIAALMQIDDGVFARRMQYVGVPYSEGLFAGSAAIVLAGCVAYLLGSAVARRREGRPTPSVRWQLDLRRVKLLTVVGLASAVALIGQAGATVFSSRGEFSSFDSDMATKVLRALSVVGAYLVVYAYRRSRVFPWRSLSLGWRFLSLCTVGAAVVANNPLVVQRAFTATVLGGLLLAWISPTSRRSITAVFLLIPVGMLVVFPFLTMFRESTTNVSYGDRIEEGIAEPLRYGAGDFGMFTQIAEGIEYVDRDGFTMGRHLMAAVFVVVPRSIWSDKPQDVGDTIHDANGYPERFNYSSPLWMELYVEGGVILLVVGFGAFGWVSRRMDHALSASPGGLIAAATPLIACYQFYLLRGSLAAAAPMMWALVAALLLSAKRLGGVARGGAENASVIDRDAVSSAVR